MPITYEFDDARARVTAVATGCIAAADITVLVDAVVAHHAARYAALLDARETEVQVSTADVHGFVALMARIRATHGHARTAVVTGNDVIFGMARMYATLAAESDSGFMVYRTVDEANAWLGWTEASAQPQSS